MTSLVFDRTLNGRIWRFSNCEFDDLRMELKVGGREVRLEPKPLEVLQLLVSRAGEVITKAEILDTVWADEAVVEGVLTTNINKLREAIGDSEKKTIATLRGVGYKLVGSVQWENATSTVEAAPSLSQGCAVPGREQWRLIRRMDQNRAVGGVWLAEHTRTHEQRVFKFALDGMELRNLKREASLSRVLHQSPTHRPEFIRILEWNFEHRPFFLESEYGGPNLREWAEAQGGIAGVPMAMRLQVMASIARAVDAAHDLGVLHRDLKPDNILVSSNADGRIQVRVMDFGSGALLDTVQIRDLELSSAGLSPERKEELAGTLIYSAPELLAGNPCTAGSDVYALGILLYQIISGNLHAPLSSGWEAAVKDSLLREDIALAANGDPGMRLTSAGALAERIEQLERRRERQRAEEQARQRAEIAERKLHAERARRPWVAAAGAILCLGLLVAIGLYGRTVRERDRANQQTAIANAIDQFLAQDLLGRTDPVVAGKPDESLLGALKQAAPEIDRKFGSQPLIAAQLHSTLARALGRRDGTEGSVREYMAAADCYVRAEGELSQDAIVERLKAVIPLSRTSKPADLEQSRQIVTAQQALLGRIAHPKPEVAVHMAMARAFIAFFSSDMKEAVTQAQAAIDMGGQVPSFDEAARGNLKHILAAAYARMGENAKAEQLLKDVIEINTRLEGAQSSVVLQTKTTLAELLYHEGRNRESIAVANEVQPIFAKLFGESNQFSLELLAIRAASESSLEEWDAAIQDETAIHLLATKVDPLSGFSTVAYSDLALYLCQAGRTSQGIPVAQSAYEQTRKAFAQRRDFIDATAFALAYCEIGAGKANEAGPLLDKIDGAKVSEMEGDPAFLAILALAKAQVALSHGDREEASRQWGAAQKVFQTTPPNAFQRRWLESVKNSLDHRQ
jgi:DNA-binding winged helix-turn-helix (wHTH) protein/serine/threonine protein kinase/sulfur carrier protein ThiS